jgi:hypothetical protein
MRFPTVFKRQKGSASSDPVLGGDSAPTTTAPAATADNVLSCRIRDVNGWPVQRIAVCFSQVGFAYTVTSAGTNPPVVTLTGTTSSLLAIEIDVNDVTGGTALGQALFTWKLGGVTQATGVATAAHVALGSTGVTANFSAGPYANNNVYTSHDAVTAMNVDAYFWEDETRTWYKINDAALSVKPNQLFFFDTVTVIEPPATAKQLTSSGSAAQAGAMSIMIVPSDPGSQGNGVFQFAAAPDLTTVGT